ncbi:alpha/beta fold hydrolase [Streptomyces sp. SID8379]|uniref:alpha/beta hydrolase n=1 Tax=unclassified Streptomyces TaxID=2593676 RepID=UPI00035C10B2|nr:MULTISPECIES: alpha/beta hydrolase [unclassified Streptomyces]MYW63171.1 alpha/beta fold hydrolase [Streptomyces sp. SID8379]
MTLPQEQTIETTAGPFNTLIWKEESTTGGGASAPVLAVHGVSSTNRLWTWLHEAAPWATLIAPDLPGRGATPARDTRPSSVRAHADGLAALLDALELDTVDVLGMSLGGFIAVELAARHPGRVRSLTLVDGGLPVPATVPADQLAPALRAQYGDATSWPDAAAYARHYTGAAAPLVDAGDPRFVAMLAHDLRDGAAGGPVRRDLDTVVDDAVSVLASSRPAAALAEVTVPIRLLHAQWAAGEGSAPMYPADHVADLARRTSHLVHTELVDRVDHAAIIMTDHGAGHCAAVLRKAVRR